MVADKQAQRLSSSLELTDEDNNQEAEKEGNGDKGTIGDWCVLLIPQRLPIGTPPQTTSHLQIIPSLPAEDPNIKT